MNLLILTSIVTITFAPATSWYGRGFGIVVFASLGVFAFVKNKKDRYDLKEMRYQHLLTGLLFGIMGVIGVTLLIGSMISPSLERAQCFSVVLLFASLAWLVIFYVENRYLRKIRD